MEHTDSPFIKTPTRTTQATRYPPTMPVASSTFTLSAGGGTASVLTMFSEPGEYMVRARVDNWAAPDSGGLFQCCWSNAFQRVRVTE